MDPEGEYLQTIILGRKRPFLGPKSSDLNPVELKPFSVKNDNLIRKVPPQISPKWTQVRTNERQRSSDELRPEVSRRRTSGRHFEGPTRRALARSETFEMVRTFLFII